MAEAAQSPYDADNFTQPANSKTFQETLDKAKAALAAISNRTDAPAACPIGCRRTSNSTCGACPAAFADCSVIRGCDPHGGNSTPTGLLTCTCLGGFFGRRCTMKGA